MSVEIYEDQEFLPGCGETLAQSRAPCDRLTRRIARNARWLREQGGEPGYRTARRERRMPRRRLYHYFHKDDLEKILQTGLLPSNQLPGWAGRRNRYVKQAWADADGGGIYMDDQLRGCHLGTLWKRWDPADVLVLFLDVDVGAIFTINSFKEGNSLATLAHLCDIGADTVEYTLWHRPVVGIGIHHNATKIAISLFSMEAIFEVL